MSKKIHLAIPEPCHENWDKMSPVDKGRFCGSCQKQVVDFSNMSDYEVAHFFKKPSTGSVCGRFMTDQLNREIEIPKKRLPWIKYFFQFALPAFLFSMKANSQQRRLMGKPAIISQPRQALVGDTVVMETKPVVAVEQPEVICEKPVVAMEDIIMGNFVRRMDIIRGQVINDKGKPVPFATVGLKNSHTATVAKEDGTFSLVSAEISRANNIVVSSVGFKEESIQLTVKQKRGDSIFVTLTSDDIMPEVVITSSSPMHMVGQLIAYTTTAPSRTIPLIDTLKSLFISPKVYPNPLPQGHSFMVELKAEKEEKVEIKIMTMDGRYLAAQVFKGVKGVNRFTMNTDTGWASAIYMVIVLNAKGDIIKTERLLIQNS